MDRVNEIHFYNEQLARIKKNAHIAFEIITSRLNLDVGGKIEEEFLNTYPNISKSYLLELFLPAEKFCKNYKALINSLEFTRDLPFIFKDKADMDQFRQLSSVLKSPNKNKNESFRTSKIPKVTFDLPSFHNTPSFKQFNLDHNKINQNTNPKVTSYVKPGIEKTYGFEENKSNLSNQSINDNNITPDFYSKDNTPSFKDFKPPKDFGIQLDLELLSAVADSVVQNNKDLLITLKSRVKEVLEELVPKKVLDQSMTLVLESVLNKLPLLQSDPQIIHMNSFNSNYSPEANIISLINDNKIKPWWKVVPIKDDTSIQLLNYLDNDIDYSEPNLSRRFRVSHLEDLHGNTKKNSRYEIMAMIENDLSILLEMNVSFIQRDPTKFINRSIRVSLDCFLVFIRYFPNGNFWRSLLGLLDKGTVNVLRATKSQEIKNFVSKFNIF